MKKIGALLLILALILAYSACFDREEKAVAEAMTDELAGVFSGGKTACLVPATPDAMATGIDELLTQTETSSQESIFVDLSPDGKTAVYVVITTRNSGESEKAESTYQLCLVRDGQLIPVTYNATRGNAESNENGENLLKIYRTLPAAERLSWSADGRYFTYSDAKRALRGIAKFYNSVPVVDTATAEMWSADSFGDDLLNEDYGVIFLSKMSRDGEYVYYLVSGRGYCRFCRCATEGGTREILCELSKSGRPAYEFYSTLNLFENADGSWVIPGQINNVPDFGISLGLIRFTPSGDEWHDEIQPAMIPASVVSQFDYSAETGTGFAVLNYPNITSPNASAIQETAIADLSSARYMLEMIQLARLQPGENGAWEVWYIKQTGDDPAAVEMVSADPFLQFVLGLQLGVSAEVPEGFSAEELKQHGYLKVLNVFLSPDGRYAILYALHSAGDSIGHLYLLDAETMEVRLVDTPDGVIGRHLIADSGFGRKFLPGIIWNDDGTLAMLTDQDGVQFFRLETR